MRKETLSGTFFRLEDRVYIKGKFLYYKNEKLYIKGVTYGTFEPRQDGHQYPPSEVIEEDFRMMAYHGINCVRTYTVPPKYLLDIALQYDLKIMVGLPWEQHLTFLDTRQQRNDIIKRVKEGVLSCKQHPAILCFTIGNEIPAPIVRWYGKKKIEKFLKDLYTTVKEADAESLVTYVNFPTTEYLELDFLDFDCFNVYLETPDKLSAYISRLHNLSGDRPLVLAEIGLDSLRNGKEAQADILEWQIETVFARGCAGMFVFAWTDEWWRGGHQIEDWDFGLVDRNRNPKPALFSVSETMKTVPFKGDAELPFISVIICTYNGSATIKDCLEGLQKLNYPRFEVIVVNDGSTDNVADIIKDYSVKLITTENCGLSSARNTGMYNAKGNILAYIDDDAYPDVDWLRYLAFAYLNTPHACIGGPNLVPPEDGPIATCVANAPGGPVHVLVSDEIAEHVPGCNMSFRKEALMSIGGFDPVYRTAGDDVDVCWRLQETGKTIGFHPSALVWHHRRNSIKNYWKQQKGYGKAEALLEAKWPQKYNGFGHVAWAGRIYGNGFTLPLKTKKNKIFHGTWGTAPFQSVYQPADGFLNSLPLMPEWYLLTGILGVTGLLGLLWTPLLAAWPIFIAAVAIVLIQATTSSYKNASLPFGKNISAKFRVLIILLHIIQPLARLYGRLKHGLTPWRKRIFISPYKFILANAVKFNHWSEQWRPVEDWLKDVEKNLFKLNCRIRRGNDFDVWDLQVKQGLFGQSKCLLTIEEHGAGKQYLKMKCWKKYSAFAIITSLIFLSISAAAAISNQWIITTCIGLMSIILIIKIIIDSALSMSAVHYAFTSLPVMKEQMKQELMSEKKPEAINKICVDQPLVIAERLSDKRLRIFSMIYKPQNKISSFQEK